VLPPGETKTGDLVIADIGIPSSVIDDLRPHLSLLTREHVRELVRRGRPTRIKATSAGS